MCLTDASGSYIRVLNTKFLRVDVELNVATSSEICTSSHY